MTEHSEASNLWSEAHNWKHRLFLVFAPSPKDGPYRRQLELLQGSEEGFAQRDLLRGHLFEEVTGDFDGAPVPPAKAAEARRRYEVETGGFAVVLVGKDGGVKHRDGEPVSPEDLYPLIDAMPMRRSEMRERGY